MLSFLLLYFSNRLKFVKKLLSVGIVFLFLAGCGNISSSVPTSITVTSIPLPTIISQSPPISLSSSQTAQVSTLTPSTLSPSPTIETPTAAPTIETNPNVTQPANTTKIKTVFLVVMENHNWSDIYNNPSAPYINNTLLPQASYATRYFNPPGNHPSEPNYIWLEAGSALGISNDSTPAKNHQSTADHLVTYLDKAGVTWKAYAEDISGDVCPLKNQGLYAPKHTPMVFFDDVTGGNDPNSTYCIAHIRPYTELQSDLQNNTVAQYNFITPNLCNDMHNSDGCQTSNAVKNGDTWLSEQVPIIMASSAYKQGGVIFVTWDESENGDHPIGMIVISPLAKGSGYSNSIQYTHSSTLRTIQELFNVKPLLGDATNATDLSDLFTTFP